MCALRSIKGESSGRGAFRTCLNFGVNTGGTVSEEEEEGPKGNDMMISDENRPQRRGESEKKGVCPSPFDFLWKITLKSQFRKKGKGRDN